MSVDEQPVFVGVRATIEEGVGRLLFSNPRRRHALSENILRALAEGLARFSAQNLPVVVLTSGVGHDVWSAGFDISEMRDDRDPLAHGKPLQELLQHVRAYPGAVLAMVSGSVWGGAVDLVMSCDLVIADHSARFAMTPANIGLPYTTSGLLRFFNNVPIHILKEMFFCAELMNAERAAHFGIINRLVARDSLEVVTRDVARNVAGKAPLVVRVIKEQLRVLEDTQPIPVDAMERIAELRRIACASDDFREGLDAFVERRQPVFANGRIFPGDSDPG